LSICHPLGVASFAAAAGYSYFATDGFTSCADDFVSAIVGFAAMAEYFIVSMTTLSLWRNTSSPYPALQFGAEIVAASFVFRHPNLHQPRRINSGYAAGSMLQLSDLASRAFQRR
jgi:hypothetical protein